MRIELRRMALSAVITALAAPCFGGEYRLASLIGEDPAATTQRLDQIEAELAALGSRLDGIPQQCGSTSCAGCDCCPTPGAYAGFAFVFARPHFGENYSYRISDVTGPIFRRTLVPFPTAHEVTPRIWVGYLGTSGFGMRYRYWQFDHGGAQVSPVDPGWEWAAVAYSGLPGPLTRESWPEVRSANGGRLAVSYGLEVHASDLELTQRVVFCDIAINFTGGVRYGRIDQDYQATGAFDDLVVGYRDFKGLGPIVGLDWRRPVGSWGIFGGVRGSLLFGETDLHIDAIRFEYDPRYHSFDWNDSAAIIGVAEAEIGVEWTRTLASGAILFLRFGYEGQLWLDAGSPNSPNGNLGFEGFSLAFGFDR